MQLIDRVPARLARLLAVGADAGDDEDLKTNKATLILFSAIVAVLASIWVIVYFAVGRPLSASIPLFYQLASVAVVVGMAKTRRFAELRFFQLFVILLLPFLLQWSLGGYAQGSAVSLWALGAPVFASMVGTRPTPWLAAFAVLTVISGLAESWVSGRVDAPSQTMISTFFVLNSFGAGLSFFLGILYFNREQARGRAALAAEQEKSETLLLNILPAAIVERLKSGEDVIADAHPAVTVMFVDIVGFTSTTADMEPADVALALDDYFSALDDLVERRQAMPPCRQVADRRGERAFLSRCCVRLRRCATDRESPTLLVVDDLHFADRSTVDFVAYLARRIADLRVLLLVTWDREEVFEGRELREVANSIERSASAEVVKLDRLSAAEIGRIVASSAPAGTPPVTASTITERSEGVPFFAVEFARGLDDGMVIDDGVPEPVAGLLEERLERSEGAAKQVQAAAAVIGRAFPPSLIRDVSGTRDEEVADALDELERLAVLTRDPLPAGGLYDFSHGMLRTVAYESLGAGRRRVLHGRADDALAASARGAPAEVGEAAQHAELAGDPIRQLISMNKPECSRGQCTPTAKRPDIYLLRWRSGIRTPRVSMKRSVT